MIHKVIDPCTNSSRSHLSFRPQLKVLRLKSIFCYS